MEVHMTVLLCERRPQVSHTNNTYRYSNCHLIEDINISRLAGLVNPLPVS